VKPIYNTDEFVLLAGIFSFILLIVCFAFILFFVWFKERQVKLIRAKLKMETDFEQTLLNTQIEIQEQTLTSVSHEIHDNIGQTLTVAKLNLSAFKDAGPVKDLITKAIQDLRLLSKSLNSDRIQSLGFEEAMKYDLEQIDYSKQFEISTQQSGDPVALPSNTNLILYRVCQEILNNTIKHSEAKNIDVAWEYTAKYVCVTIQDNGKGFEVNKIMQANAKEGLGLHSMTKRIQMIKGSLEITSEIGKGTKHVIQINT
jgi:two-component system, NarL family, sensor kinase